METNGDGHAGSGAADIMPVLPAGVEGASDEAFQPDELAAGEQQELNETARRTQLLDRQLARELDQPEPGGHPATGRYLQELSQRPHLPLALEQQLVRRAQEGDALARAQLVEAFLPLIGGVARIYRGSRTLDRVELMQEGVVGLLRALERYDPERGTPFWAYASWWVRQAMQQLVAELNRPIVLSDRALRQLSRLRDAHDQHLQDHGREPSTAELAARTGMSDSHVGSLLAAERTPQGLEEPMHAEGETIGRFGDLLVDPLAEDEYERVLTRVEVDDLRHLLSALSDRERSVLRARYGIGGPERTLTEIAVGLGVSAERVRQIEQRALAKLRQAVFAPQAPDAAAP